MSVRMNLDLPDDVYVMLETLADKLSLTRSAIIRLAILHFAELHEVERPPKKP